MKNEEWVKILLEFYLLGLKITKYEVAYKRWDVDMNCTHATYSFDVEINK